MISRNFFTLVFVFLAMGQSVLPMEPLTEPLIEPLLPTLIFKPLNGHTDHISALITFKSEDKFYIASGAQDKTIRIWDPKTCKQINMFEGHGSTVTSLCCVPDDLNSWNETLIISGGGTREIKDKDEDPDFSIRVWSLSTGCIGILKGHTDDVNSICFVEKDIIASCSYDGTIRFWNLGTMECIRIVDKNPYRFLLIARLNDDTVACGYVNHSTIAYTGILDLRSEDFKHTFERVFFNQGCPEFSPLPNSQEILLTGIGDTEWTIVNWNTGIKERSFPLPTTLGFTPNAWAMILYKENGVIFLRTDGVIWLCDYVTGEVKHTDNVGNLHIITYLGMADDQFVYARGGFAPEGWGVLLGVTQDPFSHVETN